MIKLLLGGSPCTYWSIAQKNNRETEPSGLGWDLFENYLIAKEKFKPDYFLYENNKSAAQAIKDEIKNRLNVWDGSFLTEDSGARYIEINSALVSAQNRQRFYVHNCGEVEQPEDRGILLRDILESGDDLSQNEKSYCLTSSYDGAVAWNTIERKQRTMVAEPIGTTEPVNITADGKAQTIKAQYQNTSLVNICCYKSTYGATGVAEPVALVHIRVKRRIKRVSNTAFMTLTVKAQHYVARVAVWERKQVCMQYPFTTAQKPSNLTKAANPQKRAPGLTARYTPPTKSATA